MGMSPKLIAKELLEREPDRVYYEDGIHMAEFNFSGHIIRCRDTRIAIRAVSEKYRKGLRYSGRTGPLTYRARRL